MKRMRILLVDEDAFLRDMYATKFAEANDSVMVAKDTTEALSMLDSEKPFEVVVMDLIMSDMTGTELLKAIHKHPKAKDTKCIVLSNQGEEADINEAKKAGAIGYIVKVESIPSEVVEKVHELVGTNLKLNH